MIDWIEALSRFALLHHVGQPLGLHWHTVRAVDHQRLRREVPEPDRAGIRRLLMDEFALHKKHRYATVVMDANSRQVLWVCEGKTRADTRPFFEWLRPEARQRTEAVGMDMTRPSTSRCRNTARRPEWSTTCSTSCDRVRPDPARAIQENRPAYRAVKRSRWRLLRHRGKLDEKQ